jgi:protein-S-isoprenylcysteine O-methyltransferase Ste14
MVDGTDLFWALVVGELVLAVPTFLTLRMVTAPYGRYRRDGWGPDLPARTAWVIMELPALLCFLVTYAHGTNRTAAAPMALFGLWQAHYLYRACCYPALLRPGQRMPVPVVAMGIAFNVPNAWVNARWVSAIGSYPDGAGWLTDPRFLAGIAIFCWGLWTHITADRTLRAMRRGGDTGYGVPRGGLYELVSCPNYLGEIVEWFGWALASWSPAGLAFAAYTCANLAPRALTHHAWYQRTFHDYPARRRALIPFLR